MKYQAWVAANKGAKFVKQDLPLNPLGTEEVEIAVEHCGICHSDLSMLNNEWGFSTFPAVFGHEAIGKIVAVGSTVKGLKIGQRVGVGWNAGSCMHCRSCMSGEHHLCAEAQATIAGHFGGFASTVRSHWAWAIPLPENLQYQEAGPLLCGGITVFNPIANFGKPTGHIGVVGIGGLGHMAVKFAKAYGSEVTAFTSSESKFDEARGFGAHNVVSSRDSNSIKKLSGKIDLLLVTVNVPMDWNALLSTLNQNGRLHVVGAVLEPIPVPVFSIMMKQNAISSSPTGSPVDITSMLEFSARHNIAPQTEHYPMSKINDAFQRLADGKARYRIVLDADF